MSSDLLRICDPRAYYDQFVLEDVYPDGRSVSHFRPVTIQMGIAASSAGSCLARQGGATLTCQIEPSLALVSDAPVVIPHLEAAPTIAQTTIEDIGEMVQQLIEQEAFIHKEDLKIANGRLTWILHLHIMILHMDGVIMDALSTCIVGAIMDLSLPIIVADFDEDSPIDLNDVSVTKEFRSLDLADIPVSCTFLTYDSKILCDPVMDLYQIAACSVTIVVGNDLRIHRIVQRGMCMPEWLQKMISLALGRQKVVAESLLEARGNHRRNKKVQKTS